MKWAAILVFLFFTSEFGFSLFQGQGDGGSRDPASLQFLGGFGGDSKCDSIYHLVCSRPGVSRDLSGNVRPDSAGTDEAVKMRAALIERHPRWSEAQVNEELVQEIYEPKRRDRVIAAYTWVLQSLSRYIDRQPDAILTQVEKFRLKSRLSKVRLVLPPPASVYADDPNMLVMNDVYYERGPEDRLKLKVGGGFILSSKSWFNLVFTIAHELAHSVDPCELRAIRFFLPAYDRLEACFIQSGLVRTHRSRQVCAEHDQFSEAFSDWLAVQVAVDSLNHYSTEFDHSSILNAARNSVRDLCEQEAFESDTTFHPPPQVRIELIYGRNPEIRQLLGCSPTPRAEAYCDFAYQFLSEK